MVLTITGVLLCLTALRYRKRQKVHVNHRRILANVAVTFVLMSPSRFVEIALTMNWQSEEMLDYNRAYRVADTFRCHYVMVSALMLPAAAVERFCSVVFLYDYEAVPRTKISIIVIVVVHLTAFATSLSLCFFGGVS
ncbi:hypothetical protein AAVH_18763 [Aphelenchoides avenae]|nr:hypothetical protein AAVH_18763 [Aphelenchus avenae]